MTHVESASAGANVAIVIGANRGVGRSTALALARRRVDVILTFRSNRAEAKDVVKTIESLGRKALALRLDVGAADTFTDFAERLRQILRAHWGAERFSYLVNNTGHIAAEAASDLTEARFKERADIHLQGVFFLTQHLRPLIADGGRIVNISSGLARLNASGGVASTPIKGAIEALASHMSEEFGPYGDAAGRLATDFVGSLASDNRALQKGGASITTLGRTGQSDEAGDSIAALLLSDADQWASAPRISVPGG